MKLFAIRLENADMVIITAENQKEALEKAGLTANTLSDATRRLREMGIERDHADLVLEGFGPQRYEICERDPRDLENHRAEHDSLYADAYSREKTRLMLPPEA